MRLHRRNGATGPTGLYQCVIPDSSGVEQTLFVGIYTTRENSKLKLWSGKADPLTINFDNYCAYTVAMVAPLTDAFRLISAQESVDVSFSLTCNSSGGPVSSVTWTKDGSILDNTGPLVLTNASTASYTNVLEVNSRAPGTYTCWIRGPSNQVLGSMGFSVQGDIVQKLGAICDLHNLSSSSTSPSQCASHSGQCLCPSGGQLESSIWWNCYHHWLQDLLWQWREYVCKCQYSKCNYFRPSWWNDICTQWVSTCTATQWAYHCCSYMWVW